MEAKLQPNSDILLHHGVKGMRWGVRKSREQRAANRRRKRLEKARKTVAKNKAKEKANMTKIGLTNRTIKNRSNLRKNANRELDAKIRYLKKDPKRNAQKIKKYRNLKKDYEALNTIADNRIYANNRNKKIVKTVMAVGGTAMSVPAIRKDVHKASSKVYYKLKNKAMSGAK